MQDLGTIGNIDGDSGASGVSADGSVVVGASRATLDVSHAFRWTAAGGMQDLGTIENHYGNSNANGVSADGSVIVGYSTTPDYSGRAFRWTSGGGIQNLGSLSEGAESVATGVSADGNVVIGSSYADSGGAFRWTAADGMQNLGTVGDVPGRSSAYGVSADGSVVVGISGAGDEYQSFRWTAGSGMTALPQITSGFPFAVSADGSIIVGSDISDEYVTEWNDAACVWIDSEPRLLWSLLQDDFGIDLGEQGWTSLSEVTGCSADGKTLTGIGEYQGAKTAFRVTVSEYPASNRAPTVAPLSPVTLECVEGQHRVTLATTVNDADGESLSVTWKVSGEVKKTQSGVAPGTQVSFEFDYPHGVHPVSVEVSDGVATATAGTTVTVQDTAAPIVVVATDVVVPTDAGKAYATNVTLPAPTASDASGHAVTLTSDARSSYPLGVTLVTWTATDEAGNKATATQKVTVVDQEKPKIQALPDVRSFCDSGKTFATVKLSPPKATDNAPDSVSVTTSAGPTFKIGVTNVVWTAKDAAGNVATLTQKVTVVNRKPKANAGKAIVVTTTSERGAKVSLDGSKSSDPDKHKLKYAWKAKGVKFKKGTTAKPSGVFPVGRSIVTLTVTDAAGAKSTSKANVTVKLKNAKRRPRGAQANEAFAVASRQARKAVESSTSSSSLLKGLAYANAAAAYGDAAGEFVRWEENQSPTDAHLSYAELRALQREYGAAAANALLSAYAETGDESMLAAYGYAVFGTAAAEADMAE